MWWCVIEGIGVREEFKRVDLWRTWDQRRLHGVVVQQQIDELHRAVALCEHRDLVVATGLWGWEG